MDQGWIKSRHIWPYAGLEAPKWWISVDRGWIKSVHIRDDVLGPFPGSGMAIGGHHRASKRPKMAINDRIVAISRPSGSKLVDQGRINLGHIHGNVLGQFPGSGMAIGGRHMVQKVLSAFLWPFGLFIALLLP